jgi:3-oxoacyl-[acyl-carrier-protein] synthase I
MLAVKAAGLVTSIGFNGPATCAALRAGIRNVYETNLWEPGSGTYLAAGKVPLPQWWVGIGKLADLAAPAIQECLRAAEPISPDQVPVLLCVPSHDRPYRLKDLDTRLVQEIEHRLGIRLHPASRLVPADRVAAALALRHAEQLMSEHQARCVIVAAVDSLLQQDLKSHFLSKRRLLTPENSNGFSLGEGAGAVLVATSGADGRGELLIRGIGIAREPSTIESEEPLRGEGLTLAVRDAFRQANTTIQDVQYRVSDLNGEHYRFKEMALAMVRFPRRPTGKLFDLWHPCEYIGDVGAAIGPILLAWALDAGRKQYANGPTALCTLGNDDGARAALVVTYQG